MESFIDPDTVSTLQNSQHISLHDKFIHSSHCNLNQHYLNYNHLDDEEHMEEALEEDPEVDHQGQLEEEHTIELSEESEAQQEILPLITSLTSTDEVLDEQGVERATEMMTSDIEAEPVTSVFTTIVNWISKKRGKTNQTSGSASITVPTTHDKVINEQHAQSFLPATPPRTFIP